jgi:hypothetical protein
MCSFQTLVMLVLSCWRWEIMHKNIRVREFKRTAKSIITANTLVCKTLIYDLKSSIQTNNSQFSALVAVSKLYWNANRILHSCNR